MFILIESMAFSHITVSENGESMESELLLIGKHRSGRSESDLKAKAPARDLAAVWSTRQGHRLSCTAFCNLCSHFLSCKLPQWAAAGRWSVPCSGIHSLLSHHRGNNPPVIPQEHEVPHLLMSFSIPLLALLILLQSHI